MTERLGVRATSDGGLSLIAFVIVIERLRKYIAVASALGNKIATKR